jgi:hypothetical protein
VEVALNTQEFGPLNGAIKVTINEEYRPPDSIPVTGKVLRRVEAAPTLLVLPRKTGQGDVYFGECRCFSTQGMALTLKPDVIPKGFTVHISPVEDDPSTQLVRIDLDPKVASALRADHRDILRFSAKVGDNDATLEIPVQKAPIGES